MYLRLPVSGPRPSKVDILSSQKSKEELESVLFIQTVWIQRWKAQLKGRGRAWPLVGKRSHGYAADHDKPWKAGETDA